MSRVVSVDDISFAKRVLFEDELPVLVDFYADWCGPCQRMAPMLEELAEELEGEAVIVKLNVDANHKTSMKYNVRALPTMLVFRNGEVVDQLVGLQPKPALKERLMRAV